MIKSYRVYTLHDRRNNAGDLVKNFKSEKTAREYARKLWATKPAYNKTSVCVVFEPIHA